MLWTIVLCFWTQWIQSQESIKPSVVSQSRALFLCLRNGFLQYFLVILRFCLSHGIWGSEIYIVNNKCTISVWFPVAIATYQVPQCRYVRPSVSQSVINIAYKQQSQVIQERLLFLLSLTQDIWKFSMRRLKLWITFTPYNIFYFSYSSQY